MVPSVLFFVLRAEQTIAARSVWLPALGGLVSALQLASSPRGGYTRATHLTMSAMFSANLPTLVPPNLRTTQPPGRCFSSVWFAIRSTSLL